MEDGYGQEQEIEANEGAVEVSMTGQLAQLLLSRGSVTESDLKDAWEIRAPRGSRFDEALRSLQVAVRNLGFEVRTVVSEQTSVRYYALVNVACDAAAAESQPAWDLDERKAFRAVVGLFESAEVPRRLKFSVVESTVSSALGLRGRGASLPVTLLERWIREGWLSETPDGSDKDLELGVRSLLELGEALAAQQTQSMTCAVCGLVSLAGLACRGGCGNVVHRPCKAEQIRQNVLAAPRCPTCIDRKLGLPGT